MALPDFFLIGASKAGSTALHAALARHPGLFLPRSKEPKFYLCDGRPPPRSGQRGPGDAHSTMEWVWRPEAYEALFDRPLPARCAARAPRSTCTISALSGASTHTSRTPA